MKILIKIVLREEKQIQEPMKIEGAGGGEKLTVILEFILEVALVIESLSKPLEKLFRSTMKVSDLLTPFSFFNPCMW